MANITFKGTPIQTVGELPAVGTKVPDFNLTSTTLQNVSLADFTGQRVILNIYPSVDTGICATSVRRFNAEASALKGVTVLCISRDLPFAHSRFCGAEGIDGVQSLSTMRDEGFGERYGLTMTGGPLAGLLSRAVIVLNGDGEVVYTEQVPEIVQEPDYAAALAAV